MSERYLATVVEVEQLTPVIKAVTMVGHAGTRLPAFTAGSHLMVSCRVGAQSHDAHFSLASSPYQEGRYTVVVKRPPLREAAHIYHDVEKGRLLRLGLPGNAFPLAEKASRHVLLAAGMGITPYMAHIAELEARDADFELHYVYRSAQDGVFAPVLKERFGARIHTYVRSRGEALLPERVLSRQPRNAHAYACGPQGFVEDVVATGLTLEWLDKQLHWEQHIKLKSLPGSGRRGADRDLPAQCEFDRWSRLPGLTRRYPGLKAV